ncbi:hypothetical protein [Pseudopedobacter sp.]|uniref:hypothetical protein n=1 Tax=Pseudopedobacter sp. TaxID=1936787 RepID=UPI0033427A00
MKSMSDKDFDAFFKVSLDQFEEKPTKNIWSSIENDNSKLSYRRKKFPFAWAAACIAILALGLILFRTENEKIQLRKVDELAAVSVLEDQLTQNPLPPREIVSFKPNNKAENEQRFLRLMASIEIGEKIVKKAKQEKQESDFEKTKHTVEVNETQLVSVKNTGASGREEKYIEQEPLVKEQEEILAYTDKIENKEKVKSLGDLVNFVIGKIDKRENKIIHVSKTEESDMEITGINLGLIKYRKAD